MEEINVCVSEVRCTYRMHNLGRDLVCYRYLLMEC